MTRAKGVTCTQVLHHTHMHRHVQTLTCTHTYAHTRTHVYILKENSQRKAGKSNLSMEFLLIPGPTGRCRVRRQIGSEKGHEVDFLGGRTPKCGPPVKGAQRWRVCTRTSYPPHHCKQTAPGNRRRRQACTLGAPGAESPEPSHTSKPQAGSEGESSLPSASPLRSLGDSQPAGTPLVSPNEISTELEGHKVEVFVEQKVGNTAC